LASPKRLSIAHLFSVGPQRGLRLDIGCHDQPFVLEWCGGNGQQWRLARGGAFVRAKAGAKEASAGPAAVGRSA